MKRQKNSLDLRTPDVKGYARDVGVDEIEEVVKIVDSKETPTAIAATEQPVEAQPTQPQAEEPPVSPPTVTDAAPILNMDNTPIEMSEPTTKGGLTYRTGTSSKDDKIKGVSPSESIRMLQGSGFKPVLVALPSDMRDLYRYTVSGAKSGISQERAAELETKYGKGAALVTKIKALAKEIRNPNRATVVDLRGEQGGTTETSPLSTAINELKSAWSDFNALGAVYLPDEVARKQIRLFKALMNVSQGVAKGECRERDW